MSRHRVDLAEVADPWAEMMRLGVHRRPEAGSVRVVFTYPFAGGTLSLGCRVTP